MFAIDTLPLLCQKYNMSEVALHKRKILRNDYERIVFGEVYIPNHVDTAETAMTPEEVKRVAYDFMKRSLLTRIDEMHNYTESGCYVVESFIARPGDPDFVEGAWVLATKIENNDVWEKVLRGEYNGYSIAGLAGKESQLVKLTRITEMELTTEDNIEGPFAPHSHYVHLFFSDNGDLVPGWTGLSNNHAHQVTKTTATDETDAHNHKFVVVE